MKINWKIVFRESLPVVVGSLMVAVSTWVPWLPWNGWTENELMYLVGGIYMGMAAGRWQGMNRVMTQEKVS